MNAGLPSQPATPHFSAWDCRMPLPQFQTTCASRTTKTKIASVCSDSIHLPWNVPISEHASPRSSRRTEQLRASCHLALLFMLVGAKRFVDWAYSLAKDAGVRADVAENSMPQLNLESGQTPRHHPRRHRGISARPAGHRPHPNHPQSSSATSSTMMAR